MKKIAIVSSYAESCGNASFAKILQDSIEFYGKEVYVEVISLDLNLLQSLDIKIRRAADIHIKEISLQLIDFDLVNIQMETGLYGTIPTDIIKRFKRLLLANSVTSVTLHSPRIMGKTPASSRELVKQFLTLNFSSFVKNLLNKSGMITKLNRKIIRLSISNNARLIVHTDKAKKQIQVVFSYDNIDVHPLKMVPDNYIHNPQTILNLKKLLQLGENDIIVGIFGYISPYKGHMDAIEAIKLLPKNYKLLIFGRQHPQTIKDTGEVDLYLGKLLNRSIKNSKIFFTGETIITRDNNIFFMGELDGNDFLDVCGGVDIAWLPYYENGQSGSGIASICLDLCPKVLCSRSFAFDELFKLIKYKNVIRFDIGNYNEMCTKTTMFINQEFNSHQSFQDEKYNLKSQALVYTKEIIS